MIYFLFILSALASFRLALLFAKENGPGHLAKKAREAAPLRSKLREGIECMLCESVWWSGLITIYYAIMGWVPWTVSPVFWLASSATACIIHFQFNEDEP